MNNDALLQSIQTRAESVVGLLEREKATSAELQRALSFERAQHEETKHALRRSLAYGRTVTKELNDCRRTIEQNGQAGAHIDAVQSKTDGS